MIYVFDTSSFRELQHFYPSVFKSVWPRLLDLVEEFRLISTKEVLHELEDQNVSEDILDWCKKYKSIFQTPENDELLFVSTILQTQNFASLIPAKAHLQGKRVADPFVIALAQSKAGTVVTQESYRENAAKIPP